MYAIVDIAGQQIKVEQNQKVYVNRLDGEIGSVVEFPNVLLIDNEGTVKVGSPVVEGALVSAKILDHLRGDTVLVFKKRRRKGYQVLNGHRQYLTQIEIESIIENASAKKASGKKEKVVEQTAPAVESTESVAAPSAEPAEIKEKPAKKAKAATKSEEAAATPKVKKAAPKKTATGKSEGETAKATKKTRKTE